MSKYVLAEGPLDADIVIVGEAPGAQEEAQGRPFVGGAGQHLDKMLSGSGIMRQRVYVTNVMKIRPPQNNFDHFYLDGKKRTQPGPQLLKGIKDLKEEICVVNPNVVVPMGAEPLKALCGRNKIHNWRGSIIEQDGRKYIPTLHPAFVMRMYHTRCIVEADLKRAVQESHWPEFRDKPLYKLHVDPSYEEVMTWITNTRRLKPRMTFDIETTGKHVRCLGFATSARDAFVIPFMSSRRKPGLGGEQVSTIINLGEGSMKLNSHWPIEQEHMILAGLYNIFVDPQIELIAQNFPFDSTILASEFGFQIRGLYMDTMVVQHTCYAELPKSLDFLCSIYTRTPRYSDYNPADDLDLWRYNGMDCAVTYEVAECLREEADEADVWEFYKRLVEPAMVSLTRACNRGFTVNEDEAKTQTDMYNKSIEAQKIIMEEAAGRPVLATSNKQMCAFLYEERGLPPQYKRSTSRYKPKGPSCDTDALEKLMKIVKGRKDAENLIEFMTAAIKIRQCMSVISKVLQAPRREDGKLTTSFNITGTKTGRLSSSQTIFKEGLNIQNVNRPGTGIGGYARRIFHASPGHRIIKVDLSQAEARCVAWLADIKPLIEKFVHDPEFDIHTWNAAHNVYGVAESAVTPAQREGGKVAVHAGNYRMGPAAAVEEYKITYTEAKHILEAYREALPQIPRWWTLIEDQVCTTRTLRNCLGRIRRFLDRLEDPLFRSAYATLPQGMVGDVIARAFAILDIIGPPKGFYPMIQVHDEIVFECREDVLPGACRLIKTVIEYPLVVPGQSDKLIIPAEIKTGFNWLDLKDVPEAWYNEQGSDLSA